MECNYKYLQILSTNCPPPMCRVGQWLFWQHGLHPMSGPQKYSLGSLHRVIGLSGTPRICVRAVSREIPTGNSREFPEKSCSRKFPGIISGSREFSGIFYVLRRGNVLNFTIFQMFFFWFRSSFTVEKNTIHAENHWNSSMNCIFLRIGVFLSFYKVSFKVPGNSREFPDWFREIPVPGNENLSGNRPPYL